MSPKPQQATQTEKGNPNQELHLGFYRNLNSISLCASAATGHFNCSHQTCSTAAEHILKERRKGQISKGCSFLYWIGSAERQDKEHISFNMLINQPNSRDHCLLTHRHLQYHRRPTREKKSYMLFTPSRRWKALWRIMLLARWCYGGSFTCIHPPSARITTPLHHQVSHAWETGFLQLQLLFQQKISSRNIPLSEQIRSQEGLFRNKAVSYFGKHLFT